MKSMVRTWTNHLINFLAGNLFPYVFSLIYASIKIFAFYPGILYSDSHYRWTMARYFAEIGWSGELPLEDHHPVVPTIIQSWIYQLTHEVGFFIFIQAFLFCLAFFFLVRTFKKTLLANLLTGFVLILVINQVYSIFHSFDTNNAIALAYLAGFLVRLQRGERSALWAIPVAFFIAVAFRLNTLATLPFLLLFLGVVLIRRKYSKLTGASYLVLILLVGYAPFAITNSLNLRKSNAWVVGLSLEYNKMAPKAKDFRHIRFLNRLDVSPYDLEKTSYHSERHDNSSLILQKVKHDPEYSRELAQNYFSILKHEPGLFLTEKAKFIASTMGITRPVENTEIGKWREKNDAHWEKEFREKYGFETNNYKEALIDKYLAVTEYNMFLQRPWVFFALATFLVLILLVFKERSTAKELTIVAMCAMLYYSTFFLLSGDHIFRYFFPALYLLQMVFVIGIVVLFEKVVKAHSQIVRGGAVVLIVGLLWLIVGRNESQAQILKFQNLLNSLEQLDEISAVKVYRHQEYLYLIADEPTESMYTSRFFLHVFPADPKVLSEDRKPYLFDNMDFGYRNQKVTVPGASDDLPSFVVRRKLPSYSIQQIKVGQYNEDGQVWASKIELIPKDSL